MRALRSRDRGSRKRASSCRLDSLRPFDVTLAFTSDSCHCQGEWGCGWEVAGFRAGVWGLWQLPQPQPQVSCVFAVGWRHALCCAGRPETWPGESLAHSYGLTILLHAELHPTLHECMTGVQGLARERSASNTPHMAQHVGDNPAPGTGFAAG